MPASSPGAATSTDASRSNPGGHRPTPRSGRRSRVPPRASTAGWGTTSWDGCSAPSSRSAASRRRSWTIRMLLPARCWSCSKRGSDRWWPTGGRTPGCGPTTCPPELVAGAVLVSGYLLLQDGAQEAGVEAIRRSRAGWIAVEAATWPLVEAIGPARFHELASGASVILANEREAEALTSLGPIDAARELGERYRAVAVKRGAAGAVLVVDGSVLRSAGGRDRGARPHGSGGCVRRGSPRVARARGSTPRRRSTVPVGRARRSPRARPCGRRGRERADPARRGGRSRAGQPRRPVVCLETSVIGQGLPHPRNVECIERMAGAIRGAGAVPAWVAVLGGEVVVGLSEAELDPFTEPGRAEKVARRDLPAACAPRRPRRDHRLGDDLGRRARRDPRERDRWHRRRAPRVASGRQRRSRGAVPDTRSAGVQRTEVDRRSAADRGAPRGARRRASSATASTAFPSSSRASRPSCWNIAWTRRREAAAALEAAIALDTRSTLLLCNPIDVDLAMDPAEVAAATRRSEDRAEREGVRGRDLTPFLLACLAEETGGRSLEANLALLESNARLAGEVAVAVATGARSG